VDAIFKKMQSIYLTKWTSQFHTEYDIRATKQEWAEGLQGMTGEEIKKALKKCREEFNWPPSIAEFRLAGIGGGNLPEQNSAAYKEFKRLPRPKADPKIKEAAMSRIKELMGIKKPERCANINQVEVLEQKKG
jgi:hypothetical protein